jgi:hypothetical protein
MAVMTRRLQILLDEDRYARLAQRAGRRGASVATLVREAIDIAYPQDGLDRAAAASRVLAADPIPVTDWEVMKEDLDDMDDPGRR